VRLREGMGRRRGADSRELVYGAMEEAFPSTKVRQVRDLLTYLTILPLDFPAVYLLSFALRRVCLWRCMCETRRDGSNAPGSEAELWLQTAAAKYLICLVWSGLPL
jgi:hypothetical protein